MSEMDEISKNLLGWYGTKPTGGRTNPPVDDTASKASSPAITKPSSIPTGQRLATASSSSLPTGGVKSQAARPILKLAKRSARTTRGSE